MLQRDHKHRATVKDVLHHDWLSVPAHDPATHGRHRKSVIKHSHIPLVDSDVLTAEDRECIIETLLASETVTRDEILK